MRRALSTFLQIIIILIVIFTILFLLWEPQAEGVNVGKTFIQIYIDPFVIFAYIASIPFFTILFQAFKLLGNSPKSPGSLRIIQRSAFSIIVFVIIGVTWIMLMPSDDRPPILGMGTLVIVASIAVAVVARRFEKKVQDVAT